MAAKRDVSLWIAILNKGRRIGWRNSRMREE